MDGFVVKGIEFNSLPGSSQTCNNIGYTGSLSMWYSDPATDPSTLNLFSFYYLFEEVCFINYLVRSPGDIDQFSQNVVFIPAIQVNNDTFFGQDI